MNAYVVDEVEQSRQERPGSSLVRRTVNVQVTDAPDAEAAIKEAYWVTWRDADGELDNGPTLVGIQGPPDLDPGTYLVSHDLTTLRYW